MSGKTEPRPKSAAKPQNLEHELSSASTSTKTPTPKKDSQTTAAAVAKETVDYDPSVLLRKKGLDDPKLLDPCGREWFVEVDEWYPGLVKIKCSEPRVKLPKLLEGKWTGREKAEKVLKAWLYNEWQDKVPSKRGNARR